MALEVGIVGLPGAGKTTLFTALTKTGGAGFGKENVGMASIADDRLEQLAALVGARKITPATIRVVDVPGHRAGAARRPAPGRRDPRGRGRVLGRARIRRATWRRSSSSCSSPTATTSSGGSSGSRSRRSRATRRCARRSSSCRRCSRTSTRAHTLRDFPGELPRRARAADDEAAARASRTGRAGSTSSSRPSWRRCPTRRRRSTAKAPPRSTRSCAGSATRST